MYIDAIEVIGLIAASLITSGFLPQVLKTWKTKDVSGLSLPMYLVLCTGMVLWLIYGIFTESLALIAANVVSSLLTLSIIVFILKHKNKPSQKTLCQFQ